MLTMRANILYLIVFFCLNLSGKTPVCQIQHFDEMNGLTTRAVTQIVQDNNDYIWVATWNGLHRFDGTEFVRIKPIIGDEARALSDRIRNIKLRSDGNLWCVIDNRILIFDTHTYRYTDISKQLEEHFGKEFRILHMLRTPVGDIVLKCHDGRYITMPDDDSVNSVTITDTLPEREYVEEKYTELGDIGQFHDKDLLYSHRDSTGRIWLINEYGEIYSSESSAAPVTLIGQIGSKEYKPYFNIVDRAGNIWFNSKEGAFCVRLESLPYKSIKQEIPSRVRASFHDPKSGFWMGEITSEAVALYDSTFEKARYLSPDGKLNDSFKEFGAKIYSINKDDHGNIWLGAKPHGLYRLSPSGNSGYKITHIYPDGRKFSGDVYDIEIDKDGRLWAATLGAGIFVIPDPQAQHPKSLFLTDYTDYPSAALSVRDLEIVGDSLLAAATTGGLLMADLSKAQSIENLSFSLHVTSSDHEGSLGNIATMVVEPDFLGHLWVATESDGINMLTSPLSTKDVDFYFKHFNETVGLPSDVTYSLIPDSVNSKIWAISNCCLSSLDPATGSVRSFTPRFMDKVFRFSEGKPLRVKDNTWFIGHEGGGIVVDLNQLDMYADDVPLMFTSLSIRNQPNVLIPGDMEQYELKPHERDITLHFAALDFTAGSDHRYAFRINNGEWTDIGKNRSVSFFDLSPGNLELEVKTTDRTGNWLQGTAKLTLVVKPKFNETIWAKILFGLVILLITCAIIRLYFYVRHLKRRQREIQLAYLKLLETPVKPIAYYEHENASPLADNGDQFTTGIAERQAAPAPNVNYGQTTVSEVSAQSEIAKVKLGAEDERFMNKVVEFINLYMSDSTAGVGEMADFIGVSRSGLIRKMKTLVGLPPSDFIKKSRLGRAATLLSTTTMSIIEIAEDCGFSDQNYFGKSFKSEYGKPPRVYRKETTQT